MKRNTVAQPDACGLSRELGTIFDQLRRYERAADAEQSEDSRTKLGNFKRGVVDRVENLMPAIWRVLSDAAFRNPDILERFLQLCTPSPRQTSLTWGPFLGRLRELLDSASVTADSIKFSGHAAATDAVSDAEAERASFGSSRLRKPAVQQVKETSTCKELAERWSLGESTIRRIFRDEPGVLRIPHSRRRGKRDYISIRIPASVEARVRSRMSRPLFRVEVE